MVKLLLAVPGIRVFQRDKEGKSAMDVARTSAVASLLEECEEVKRTFRALLLALAHRGVPRAQVAADLAMHGLPDARAKAMAVRMRNTWPG